MNVQSYLFQSPSPQQVQVGRPDTSVTKEETNTETETKANEETKVVEETQAVEPQNIENPLKNPNQILDLYV